MIVTDRNAARPVDAGVTIVWTLKKLFGDAFEVQKVERLLQSKSAMDAIFAADDPAMIPPTWQAPLEQFKQLRAKYLIYP